MHGRRTRKTSGMTLSIKEPGQKLRRAPIGPFKRGCLSKARRQLEKKKTQSDSRRRRIAFENLAKEMLRYLDNSDDVKVGITELQERLEMPVQIDISIQQVAQLARSENGQKIFEVFWQEEEELCIASWQMAFRRKMKASRWASDRTRKPLGSQHRTRQKR